LLVSFLQGLSGVGAAAQVLVVKHLLSILFREQGHLSVLSVLPSVVLLAVLTIAIRLASIVSNETARLLSGLLEARAVEEITESATGADLLDYERPGFHDMLQRAQMAAMSRPAQMVTSLTVSIGAVTTIAGLAGALLTLKPILVALLACGAIPVWILSRAASRLMYQFAVNQTQRDRDRLYTFWILTHREMAAEIRAFSLIRFLRDRLHGLYRLRLEDLRRLAQRRITLAATGAVLSAVITLAVMVLLVWMVEHGQLALSAAGAAAGAVFILGERLHGLGGTSASLYENTLYMQDYTTFAQRWPARPRLQEKPALSPFSTLKGEGLSFCYPSRPDQALDDVSIEIRRGEVVALVGRNGSGKTTLAKVLAGLYTPETGRVLWDGTDVREVDPSSLRRSIAVIFQEYGQYQMTAAENIGFGDIDRLDDRPAIVDAGRWAGADGFIEDLPLKYDNRLGSEHWGGANLSLGQWQRIALARAYFRNAPFIILDEPTAALDAKAEADLFQSAHALYQSRAVLLISHRFSSVRSADRIYVLEHGRVIEEGTHEQLVALDGRYAELFKLQAAAYDVSGTPAPSDSTR
jgi:ATP-binding cassette subfamily B protein